MLLLIFLYLRLVALSKYYASVRQRTQCGNTHRAKKYQKIKTIDDKCLEWCGVSQEILQRCDAKAHPKSPIHRADGMDP